MAVGNEIGRLILKGCQVRKKYRWFLSPILENDVWMLCLKIDSQLNITAQML